MARVGQIDEWHLDFRNSFRHLAFDFGTWLGQPAIVIAPPLFQARFVTIGSVSDSMSGDGVKQAVVQPQAVCCVTGSPWPSRFRCPKIRDANPFVRKPFN